MFRNAEMVAKGARECIGFQIGKSNGTRNCIRLAEAAGIPTKLGVE
jgi:hypothetical protein